MRALYGLVHITTDSSFSKATGMARGVRFGTIIDGTVTATATFITIMTTTTITN